MPGPITRQTILSALVIVLAIALAWTNKPGHCRAAHKGAKPAQAVQAVVRGGQSASADAAPILVTDWAQRRIAWRLEAKKAAAQKRAEQLATPAQKWFRDTLRSLGARGWFGPIVFRPNDYWTGWYVNYPTYVISRAGGRKTCRFDLRTLVVKGRLVLTSLGWLATAGRHNPGAWPMPGGTWKRSEFNHLYSTSTVQRFLTDCGLGR